MFYKKLLPIFIFVICANCSSELLTSKKNSLILKNNYSNKGFTLVYNEDLHNKKVISNKIEERSLVIFHHQLKRNTRVKITNLLNEKSLIATVGKKSEFPHFFNSVISTRISDELKISNYEPYIEIIAISENSFFVAKKSKTFEEEKRVAAKVPVNDININDLNVVKKKKKVVNSKKFSYFIKIADFYFDDTASLLIKRIKKETKVKNPKIQKISDNKYRVYLGPFSNINSLQKSYNDIKILEFEKIEIIKND
tara:strand:+ start:210 stop:968 length:759 start_codon:yes stop_codon:yes gene_type:complete